MMINVKQMIRLRLPIRVFGTVVSVVPQSTLCDVFHPKKSSSFERFQVSMKMGMYLYLLYLVAIYFFVIFFQLGSALTTDQFDEWKCGRICEDDELRDLVAQTCYKLSLLVRDEIVDPYNEEKVKELSGCESNVPVQFQKGSEEVFYWRRVGKCYFSKQYKRCITMGNEKKEVLVYSFSGKGCSLLSTNHRYEMQMIDIAPEPQKKGFLNMILSLVGYTL